MTMVQQGISIWIARARSHPSAVLLIIQLLSILLYPLLEGVAGGRVLLTALGLLVLVSALWVVKRSQAATWVGTLLALGVAGIGVIVILSGRQELLLPLTVLESMFYFYATVALTFYMLDDQRATLDELFAAGATFTVLAWAFAHLFVICQALIPGSFSADPIVQRNWIELLFLSFTTLSGVGLGDIMPAEPMARALVMLAEFAGVMYIALVVSRLVAISVLSGKRGD